MFEINSLSDIRGNNVAIYSIKTLLERGNFPKLSILSGVMGVGKTSAAKLIAKELDYDHNPRTYNFGMNIDMKALQEEVFAMNPAHPRAFIFEELHGLPKNDQNALLQMFDSQSSNVYIICTTTELYKVLRTVRSRAQVWEFKLLSDKQLSALLDDYLKMLDKKLSSESKTALLRACKGIPRDLIKSVDFALAGEFNGSELDSLLGNISDESVFAAFCALRSDAVDFVVNIESLLETEAENKLEAMRDFWLRYILERSGAVRKTLSGNMIKTLDELYPGAEAAKVAKMLLRATPETLMLELVTLNMALTAATSGTVLGQQKEAARNAETSYRIQQQKKQTMSGDVRVTTAALNKFVLGGDTDET